MKWLCAFGAALLLPAAALARDVGSLSVTSVAFTNGGPIPSEYTCEGRSVSPPISWAGVPSDAKSIAVIVDDPDAPHGPFEHFAVFNLPPSQRSLPSQGRSPYGKEGLVARNSTGVAGFAPICPPSGTHHYRFQVLALDARLPESTAATAKEIANAVQGHVLARGELTGVYENGATSAMPPR